MNQVSDSSSTEVHSWCDQFPTVIYFVMTTVPGRLTCLIHGHLPVVFSSSLPEDLGVWCLQPSEINLPEKSNIPLICSEDRISLVVVLWPIRPAQPIFISPVDTRSIVKSSQMYVFALSLWLRGRQNQVNLFSWLTKTLLFSTVSTDQRGRKLKNFRNSNTTTCP